MKYLIMLISTVLTVTVTTTAQAFCGFYVARADTELFNRASQVVLVRDGDRTVLTMANDFEGDVEDFAIVIPVPTKIERGQINVGDRAVIQHLDAYTAPRLVEYHDPDPCRRVLYEMATSDKAAPESRQDLRRSARSRGVTIEAQYTVGEYDILILSATESGGLVTWLNENDYRLPSGARRIVDSYLKQDMRFFVARVNLEEQAKLGFQYLRPIQVAYEHSRFMLPIRLGTLNAKGKQELFVYALTRTGRIETTNYRTVKLPSNIDVPEFVEGEFADFYRAMFERQTIRENERAVFLEYAWDMAWCDPCAADPLTSEELKSLGVFWLDDRSGMAKRSLAPAQNVFVTRLHVRYDAEHFPEDLMFQETGDRQNYQGRFVIRHAWKGEASCDISDYEKAVRERQEREAQQLANLTGWDIDDVRDRMNLLAGTEGEREKQPWWKRLWQ